jgi:uncharacterized hydrophobic protein (TIGR00271 family)
MAHGFGFLRNLRSLWQIQLSPQERRAVLDELFFERDRRRPYLSRFTTLLSLSVAIATFGLLADSGAVVIGAMLVAPLMTPILAVAAALVMGWSGRQFRSLALVLVAIGWVILLSALLAFLAPDNAALPDEVMARTNPTLLDLGIALAAGTAAAYTLVRQTHSAIPGVAISVALAVPLVVVGITLEEGHPELAAQAFLLFATNLVAVILSASIVLLLTGFSPRMVAQRASRRIGMGLIVALTLLLLISIPLGIHSVQIVQEAVSRHDTTRAVEAWLEGTELEATNIHLDGDEITIDVAGPEPPPPTDLLLDDLESIDPGTEVTIRWVERVEMTVMR